MATQKLYGKWAFTGNVYLLDSDNLYFGTGQDVQVRWDGTDLDILASTDDYVIKLGNGTKSFDVWLYGNTAAAYILWDASGDDLIFQDSVSLYLGTGKDVEIRWDATDLDILASTDDYVIKVGNGTNSFDVWLYGNTAAAYILWDASGDDLIFQDSVSLIFGTGKDVEVRWDGTDLDILGLADDQIIKVGNGTNSFDVWLYGNTASDYLLWDASGSQAILTGAANLTHAIDTSNQVVLMSRNTLAYTDTTKDLFQIPGNADIVGIIVNVTTAFNAGTNDFLDLGITATPTRYRDDLDISSTGQTVTGWSNLGDVGGSAVQVVGVYTQTGTAATAGAATVTILWTVA